MKTPDDNEKPKPGLYLVATPIGNLGDITHRAVRLLSSVDVIACEDTRVSGFLLKFLEIRKRLIPLHDHNETSAAEKIIDLIRDGKSVALISDAGMPMISDPGYKLVQAAIDAGIYVTSLPGANAPLMALQLSGLASDRFCFAGFLPSRTKARKDMMAEWKDIHATLIFFESAHRIEDSLRDLLAVLGDRRMALARELTKKFEDIRRGAVSDILAGIVENGAPKGEIVLVVEGASGEGESHDIETLLIQAMATSSVKDAVAYVAEISGRAKKDVYACALNLKDRDDNDDIA